RLLLRRTEGKRRGTFAHARNGSLAGLESDTFHESDPEIFLGGRGLDRSPDGAWRGDRPLRGRRLRILRFPLGRMASLFGYAHLARAIGDFRDRHFLAGHWSFHRPGRFRV